MIITYLLQVSLCWVFFYLIYYIFLRKETFFGINRIYLMSTLLFSLFIPQLGHVVHDWFRTSPAEMGQVVYYMAETPQIISDIILPAKEGVSFWQIILYSIYLSGVMVAFSRFVLGLKKIFDLYKNGRKIIKENFTLVETERPHLPFSFFHFVFISKKVPLKDEVKEVISHELCHVKNLHSLDIIALELIHVLFWFNPILFLYKKALRQAHEYTADATVLEHTDTMNYGQILLGQTSNGMEVALANHFFNSQLKNRISMMYQKKSGRKALLKYLVAIPILILTAFLFSNSVLKDNPNKIAFIEDMNRIAQAGSLLDSKNTMLLNDLVNNYLSRHNLSSIEINEIFEEVAPKIGISVSIEGEFEVEKLCINEYTSTISSINKTNDTVEIPAIYKLIGEALQKANHQGPFQFIINGYLFSGYPYLLNLEVNNIKECKFIEEKLAIEKFGSGINSGILVLEVNNLSREKLIEMGPISKSLNGNSPYNALTNADEMPRFPGCDLLNYSMTEKDNCAKKKFIDYLYGEIKYPSEARDQGIEGIVIVQFIITDQGKIAEAEVVKGIGGGCDEEALYVINRMNSLATPWIPGIKDGSPVSVQITLPIKFKLEGNSVDPNSIINNTSGKVTNTSNQQNEIVVFSNGKGQNNSDEKPLTTAEQMPRFPGCEDKDISDIEKEACAKNSMLMYIYQNLTYPKAAKDNGIEGMTVVQFTVKKDGSIGNVKVLKDIGGNCGDAAAQVVKSMNNMSEKWVPGLEKGKPVDVLYTLPVRFKLDGKTNSGQVSGVKEENDSKLKDEVFNSVEQMPRFPGCEEGPGTDLEKEECAKKAMLQYIYENLTYPKIAKDNGVEGMCVVQFIVRKDGRIDDVKVLRDIGSDCGEASAEAVKSMNNLPEKWTPGMQRGKAVDVLYTLPVRFKLKKDKEESSNEPLMVLDGKVLPKVALQDIDPKDIKSISVLKDKTAIDKYGDSGRNGVIEVITKGSKISGDKITHQVDNTRIEGNAKIDLSGFDEKILFVLDDIVLDRPFFKTELTELDIERINVLKGQSARDKYGEKGKDGVVEIFTKAYKTATNKNSDPGKESNTKTPPAGDSGFETKDNLPIALNEYSRVDFLTNFNAFPVPSKGNINLELEGNAGPIQVRVFGMDGKLMHSEHFNGFNGHLSTNLVNAAFTRTIAIIAVIQSNKVQTKKVVFE